MNKRARNILFFIFVLAFFTITPILIIYAQGYQFNLAWPPRINLLVQKTGMLIINTEPKGARIFINGKQIGSFANIFRENNIYTITPAKIKNLIPGEYTVRLERDNYWPWEKKLEIKPGESTFAEDIVLFRNDLPQLVLSDVKTIFDCQNNDLWIFDDRNLMILNMANEKTRLLASSSISKLHISKNFDYYLLDDSEYLKLFDPKNKDEFLNLYAYIEKNPQKISWREDKPTLIYYQTNDFLKFFDTIDKASAILLNKPGLLDFEIKKDKLYLLAESSDACRLTVLNIDSLNPITEMDIPCSRELNFANTNHKYTNLLDPKHEMLYIADPMALNNRLKNVINGVSRFFWVNDDKILYANDFEIWLYDISANDKKLITRISQPIKKIIWHPSNNYIIYSTDTTINTIELDDREKRIITELVKLENIKDPHLSKDGKILFFIASIGNQSSLYKLYLK